MPDQRPDVNPAALDLEAMERRAIRFRARPDEGQDSDPSIAVDFAADVIILIARVRQDAIRLTAYATLDRSQQAIIRHHDAKLRDDARIDHAARETIASERDANAILTEEAERLRARVRELEAEVVAQKAIISTGMSAFMYGREHGRGEGVAAERKRCVEIARTLSDEVGERIADAIERGE